MEIPEQKILPPRPTEDQSSSHFYSDWPEARMSRYARLKSEVRRVRSSEPEKYKLALRAHQSIRPYDFKQAQNVGVVHYDYTVRYEQQTTFSTHHLRLGSLMLIISTHEFWELQRTTPLDTPTAIRNSSERVWVSRVAPHLLLVWEYGNETVRQIVAPLSDALGFDGTINHAADVVCSDCGARSPWRTSVFCHLCQATVWCSERCKERDATHEVACSEERSCAEHILSGSQSKPHWPFVLGLSGSIPFSALPFKCAIELPLIPSMLLGGLSSRDAQTLVQNNILVRRLYELDLEERARRAEASAEANATQLIEEEESVRDRRERRRLKKKTRKKVAAFESAPPMAPPCTATTSDDDNTMSLGTIVVPTPPSTDDSAIVPLEHDEPSELICPITQTLMCDPVVIASGHTYERQAIEAWFARSSTNPLTGAPVPHTHLISNITVRALCQEYNQLRL